MKVLGKLCPKQQLYSISEHSPSIRFQTPKFSSENEEHKKSDKPLGLDVKKLVANALKGKIVPEKGLSRSAGVTNNDSGKNNPTGSKASSGKLHTPDGKEKVFKKSGFVSAKIKPKRLKRQNSIHGDM